MYSPPAAPPDRPDSTTEHGTRHRSRNPDADWIAASLVLVPRGPFAVEHEEVDRHRPTSRLQQDHIAKGGR